MEGYCYPQNHFQGKAEGNGLHRPPGNEAKAERLKEECSLVGESSVQTCKPGTAGPVLSRSQTLSCSLQSPRPHPECRPVVAGVADSCRGQRLTPRRPPPCSILSPQWGGGDKLQVQIGALFRTFQRHSVFYKDQTPSWDIGGRP